MKSKLYPQLNVIANVKSRVNLGKCCQSINWEGEGGMYSKQASKDMTINIVRFSSDGKSNYMEMKVLCVSLDMYTSIQPATQTLSRRRRRH